MSLGKRELMRWYAVYQRQTTEEAIANEYLYPPAGQKPRKLPPPEQMRQMVDQRLAELRQQYLEAGRDGE